MPASDKAATTLTLAGNAAAASRAEPLNTQQRGIQSVERDPVGDQIGRAGKAIGRFARHHLHRTYRAFGGGRDRVETDQRAGRHDDLAASRASEFDEIGARQQGAGAQHHDLLAGAQHWPADLIEDRSRRAFDHKVRMIGHRLKRDQRTANAFAVEPGLRLGMIPCRDARQRKTRQTLRQLARHGLADLAQPGNGYASRWQIVAPVIVASSNTNPSSPRASPQTTPILRMLPRSAAAPNAS